MPEQAHKKSGRRWRGSTSISSLCVDSPPCPPRSAHHTSGRSTRRLAAREHGDAIDEHIAHAGRVLRRLVERSVITNGGRIEDDDVRVKTRRKLATFTQPEVSGGQGA